jgi:arylsulfatase A-like enzyme
VKRLFDGYDTGVRYADQAIGRLCDTLDDLGVLDETAIWVTSDHGEAFGELGVYADHQGADQATAHVPAVLRWPGLPSGLQEGLHLHLDVAATVVDLLGAELPSSWDGRSLRTAVESGAADPGRDELVLTQGAWSVQRGVRFGDHLYLRTWHDGYHPHWSEEMLFDVEADPHEQVDLVGERPDVLADGRARLEAWTAYAQRDPVETILAEGGPCHVQGHLPAYLQRLRATGRRDWAEVLEHRHPADAAG